MANFKLSKYLPLVAVIVLTFSLEQKSKRTTLKQKYKVEKKVREHHKKLRRDAKKNPNKRQSMETHFGYMEIVTHTFF